MTRWLAFLASVVLGLATAPRADAGHEIVIGLQCDRTGATQTVGVVLCPGYHDYVNLVNSKGGLSGHKIKALEIDHEYKVPQGVEAYERFKKEGVVLEGLYGTPQTLALTKKLEEDKILGTAPGERPMRPDFGCGIHDLVFQANTAALRGLVQQQVREALVRWEPRIDVLDVRVDNGTIAELGSRLDTNSHRVVDAQGLILAPAFVDPHVHLRTPGREDEETIASGTQAAAAGGYCAILAMPNTEPNTPNSRPRSRGGSASRSATSASPRPRQTRPGRSRCGPRAGARRAVRRGRRASRPRRPRR